MRRVDRINRIAFTILGLLLLAAGVFVLARGWGLLGDAAAEDPVIDPLWRDFVRRNEEWFWPVIVAALLLLAFVAQRWLRKQIPESRPAHGVDLVASGNRGLTRVRAVAIAQAVSEDIGSYERVQEASARVVIRRPSPRLEVRITVDDECDLDAVRDQIEKHALERLARALAVSSIDTVVLFDHASPLRAFR